MCTEHFLEVEQARFRTVRITAAGAPKYYSTDLLYFIQIVLVKKNHSYQGLPYATPWYSSPSVDSENLHSLLDIPSYLTGVEAARLALSTAARQGARGNVSSIPYL
ncbi:hypothetical protein Y032_0111g258 [Ancylostoma ceylanicum]|uniref:Uncharacterized protein n=1 Tax=Ancylostoma ceylanicum TaxID=53326 RepID=A0A016TEJ0_9BILA|nr:hypothetical protein Y032_0111g258 [Ancylostoma ceylanicum]